MTVEAALDLLRGGDAAGALAVLGDALPTDDVDSSRHAAVGMVQLANEHPVEALAALRIAVALGDTSPATLLNLALAQEKAGDTERAIRMMEALERQLPEWDEPPLRLAETLRSVGYVIPRSPFGCKPKAGMPYQRGRAYSQDLRERVFAASDDGERVGELAELLRVSVAYVSKALTRRRTTGETTVRAQHDHKRRTLAPFYAAIRVLSS